jgi:hypothetical protein
MIKKYNLLCVILIASFVIFQNLSTLVEGQEINISAQNISSGDNVEWGGPKVVNGNCLHVYRNWVRGERVFAQWDVFVNQPGQYKLFATYASEEPRDTKIYWNGIRIAEDKLKNVTGSWFCAISASAREWDEGITVQAVSGKNTLSIERGDHMPVMATIL